MPPPFSNAWVLGRPWEILLPAGTVLVSQTLPPMIEPLPMVTRPRIVAPE